MIICLLKTNYAINCAKTVIVATTMLFVLVAPRPVTILVLAHQDFTVLVYVTIACVRTPRKVRLHNLSITYYLVLLACTPGTYSDGPNLCLPCPDVHHTTIPPASGLQSCICKKGFQSDSQGNCQSKSCSVYRLG